ncbi:deoxyribodipyrimidine photo-lyase (DNA photolyase) [Phlyctema vagabunda]|uniref:Deoxyribodipyrimidine photo-lyase (DNA photolyase) n=1 Tax=Phlyctema vagabunda TaxID=108571 RepID=A0ABR4PPN2_9HELO
MFPLRRLQLRLRDAVPVPLQNTVRRRYFASEPLLRPQPLLRRQLQLLSSPPHPPPPPSYNNHTPRSPFSTREMPPKKASTTGKRKGAPDGDAPKPDVKKSKISDEALRQPHPGAQESETSGIVLRKYYPPEMSNARARAYNTNALPRPYDVLKATLEDTRVARDELDVQGKKAVVHWFKCDLRTRDNHALHLAGRKAKELRVPLVAMYIVSPQDFEAHLTAPVRVDFILRTLEVLKQDLAELNIPLHVETVEKRKAIPGRIMELLREWDASHLFANAEYEVDELRREAKMIRDCLQEGIAMDVIEDTCIVAPGTLRTGVGKQYAVYSPWFKSWVKHVHEYDKLLDLWEPPSKNPASARKKFAHIFKNKIPLAPKNKSLSEEEQKRFRAMWPAGEAEAHERLQKFADERIGKYDVKRNSPADNWTSSLSVHFASGTLSARTAVRTARDHNETEKLDGGNQGIQTWISEVAWRDFYKHVLAHWPYVCMNKPFKPEYTNILWEYGDADFEAWCAGRTGFPIVDAAMRQLNHCGWMHNRCRMIVGSFLAKHLLIDWRRGERYFMEHLIDGDFASNNGGWGFAASTGVDPQPYFRIFNPLMQSERFDPDGAYIRRWIPELAALDNKAIHEPYERREGKRANNAGYPSRMVDHAAARQRCLARYKEGLGRETA